MNYIEQARALDTPDYTEESAFHRILGRRIKQARQAKGWDQAKLAKVLKVSQSGLARIECGQIKVSVYRLICISDALDMGIKLVFSNKLYKVQG